MGVGFDGNTANYLSRSSGVIDFNAAYTICGWFSLPSLPGGGTHYNIFVLSNATAIAYDLVAVNSSGQLYGVAANGSFPAAVTGSTLSTDTWYHVALVRSGAGLQVYLNGTLDITDNRSIASRAASDRMYVGVWQSGGYGTGDPLNGRASRLKAWSTALTAAEIANESRLAIPRRLSDLYGFWPMRPGSTERVKDYGGGGSDWATNGTVSDVDDPPITWGIRQRSGIRPGYARALATTIASGSTTPDTSAVGVARALATTIASGSAGNDAAVLGVAYLLATTIASGSAGNDAAVLGVAYLLATSIASGSTTPDTAAITNLLALATAIASGSTTPDTSAVAVARALATAIASESTTGAIDFEPILVLLLDRLFRLPARRATFVLTGERTFTPVARRSFEAHLMAVAEVPKDPDEVLTYGFDYTTLLDGDTISTSSWSASGVTVDANSKTTTTTTVQLSGGTLGTKNKVKNTVVTTGGLTIVRRLVVVIQEM